MTTDDMGFLLGLIDKLCEHLDRTTEEMTELRKENAELTRQLARIGEATEHLVTHGVYVRN